MYKARDTRIGNAGNGRNVVLREMLQNIPGNVLKHSREHPQTFRGMSPNVLAYVTKHSEECHQTVLGMSSNTLGNILKNSEECHETIRGMLPNILGNTAKHSLEYPHKFRGSLCYSRKLGCRISPRFNLTDFVVGLNQENQEAGGSPICPCVTLVVESFSSDLF